LEDEQDQAQMRMAVEDCIANFYEYDLGSTAAG
jgi:hypothetical protein